MRIPENPVVYQIYPRSFQDSNGDGIGDLKGITKRLDHLKQLGVDALWMSPIFDSPMHDYGYDVRNYRDIVVEFGTLEDLDELIAEAHKRDIGVLLDMILQHTSIDHPWFHEHPEYYIRADRPLNNWTSCFGGSQWSKDPDGERGGYYMHKFYPEQPDLNWRNPEVRKEMYDVMSFWLDRGVDGFRVDAVDGMYRREDMADMPPKPADSHQLPNGTPEFDALLRKGYDHDLPETVDELGRIRKTFPDVWFVSEAYVPVEEMWKYAQHMDATFNFQFLQSPMDAKYLAHVIQNSPVPGTAWVLSNHDFPRLVSKWGRELAHAAAVMLFTLPGTAFVYQGDEIGMTDGPGGENDRFGRDAYRHPMQWNASGDFTTVVPWLPLTDPMDRNVADQEKNPDSILNHYRRLIVLRREMSGPVNVVSADDHVLVYERDADIVAVNLGDIPSALPSGDIVFRTDATTTKEKLSPHSAVVAKKR